MKIHIESSHGGWVDFTCELGRAEGKWPDAPEYPGLGGGAPEYGDHDVTFTLTPPIEVTPAMARVPLFEATREGCLLRGEIVAGKLWGIPIELAPNGWMAIRSGPLRLSPVTPG